MKKSFFKIICINFLIISFLVIFAEFCLNVQKYFEYQQFSTPEQKATTFKAHLKGIHNQIYHRFFRKYYEAAAFRDTYTKHPTNNKDIIILGCSFMYGTGLKKEELFSSVLSDYTNKTVYNFAINGGGIRNMLHILNSDSILSHFSVDKNNVQCIIYAYMFDHQRRLYANIHPYEATFKEKDGMMREIRQNRFLRNSYFRFLYDEYLYKKTSQEKNWELFCKYIRTMKRTIDSKFKNGEKETMFVILVYPNEIGNENWDDLKNEDITIIKVNDLINIDVNAEDFVVSDGIHPSALVWELLVPPLSDKLELK